MIDQIVVQDVSKIYLRGKERSSTLRHSIQNWIKAFDAQGEKFHALQDINLSIKQGEVVGIVGPNGAGKSTLLKLLSRITYPTKGKITIVGTLSSMLEVGTGFHPELTGRENIFLNGAIMGMRNNEINRKLESIISFSELELFIDTPVKHYSSGMYVRLAFSVAAHLEPDILLIDEVLAVGDQAFRKKCLDKILDVSASGKTILMVSHQMSYLRTLCKTGLYLRDGLLKKTGSIDDVIESYINDSVLNDQHDLLLRTDRDGTGLCAVSSIQFLADNKIVPYILFSGQSVTIQVSINSSEQSLTNVEVRMDCFDFLGRQWFVLNNSISSGIISNCPGNVSLNCTIPKLPLNEGRFFMDVSVYCKNVLCDRVKHAVEFEVEKGKFYDTGRLPLPAKGMLVDYSWTINEME